MALGSGQRLAFRTGRQHRNTRWEAAGEQVVLTQKWKVKSSELCADLVPNSVALEM